MMDDYDNVLSDDDDEVRVNNFITMPTKGKVAITKSWNKLTESIPVKQGFNTAIVTGEISDLTVLDIDKPKKGELDGLLLIKMFSLENCYTVKTPSGGFHIYFNYVEGIKTGVRFKIEGKVYSADIRGQDGYVVAPPSKNYNLITDCEITDMPDALIDALIEPIQPKSKQHPEPVRAENPELAELWEIFTREEPHEAKNFTPLHMKNEILNTTRLKPSYCDICDRTHDNDNTLFLTIQEKTRLFRGCIRKPDSPKFIFDTADLATDPKKKYRIRLPKPVEVEEQKSTAYDMLKSASDKCYGFSVDFISGCKKLMERFTSDTVGVTAVKSEKGTGKTYTMAQEWKKPKYDNARIQIVTFRVSLANNYKLEFDGFKHYQEHDKLSINDKNIICMDSLYKLNMKKKNPSDKWINDVLYMDEISQTRLHLTSKTYLKQPRFEQNHKAIIMLIKYSKHIIIGDANLSFEDINWINEIRGEGKGKTYTFQNNFINDDKKRTFTNIKKAEVISLVIDDVKEKRPVFLATNGSVDSINELERQVILATEAAQSKILTIHSRNQNQEAQRKFILDPNTELRNNGYLLIITSPCIQSGFNISLPNYISNIYGIFGNSTNSPNDADQMLGRVRNPINNTINYSFKNSNRNIGPTTTSDYKKHILANAHSRIDEMDEAIYGRLQGDYNESGEYKILNSRLLKVFCKDKAYQNRQLLNWHKIFIMRQIVAGHKVILDPEFKTSAEELKIVKTTAKQAKVEVKDEKAELLNTVTPATDEEAKAFTAIVNKGGSLSNIQQAQIEKNFLLNTYGIDHREAPDAKEWYLEYNDKKHMKAYRIQKKIFSITECGRNEGSLTGEKGDPASSTHGRNRDLSQALKNIKLSDINRLKGQNLGDDPKETLQKTADLVTANLQAAKIELLFEWLNIFGITDNLYTRNLVENDMYKALNKIHGEYLTGEMLEQTVDILGKNKKRTASIGHMRLSDEGFTRKILDFVNGSFNELLGVKIKKTSRKGGYQFKNEYLDNDIFTVQKTDNRPYYCEPYDDDEVFGSCDELEY